MVGVDGSDAQTDGGAGTALVLIVAGAVLLFLVFRWRRRGSTAQLGPTGTPAEFCWALSRAVPSHSPASAVDLVEIVAAHGGYGQVFRALAFFDEGDEIRFVVVTNGFVHIVSGRRQRSRLRHDVSYELAGLSLATMMVRGFADITMLALSLTYDNGRTSSDPLVTVPLIGDPLDPFVPKSDLRQYAVEGAKSKARLIIDEIVTAAQPPTSAPQTTLRPPASPGETAGSQYQLGESQSGPDSVAYEYARLPDGHPHLEALLAAGAPSDIGDPIRRQIWVKDSAPRDALRLVVADPARHVVRAAAERADAPLDVLEVLAKHTWDEVRYQAKENPNWVTPTRSASVETSRSAPTTGRTRGIAGPQDPNEVGTYDCAMFETHVLVETHWTSPDNTEMALRIYEIALADISVRNQDDLDAFRSKHGNFASHVEELMAISAEDLLARPHVIGRTLDDNGEFGNCTIEGDGRDVPRRAVIDIYPAADSANAWAKAREWFPTFIQIPQTGSDSVTGQPAAASSAADAATVVPTLYSPLSVTIALQQFGTKLDEAKTMRAVDNEPVVFVHHNTNNAHFLIVTPARAAVHRTAMREYPEQARIAVSDVESVNSEGTTVTLGTLSYTANDPAAAAGIAAALHSALDLRGPPPKALTPAPPEPSPEPNTADPLHFDGSILTKPPSSAGRKLREIYRSLPRQDMPAALQATFDAGGANDLPGVLVHSRQALPMLNTHRPELNPSQICQLAGLIGKAVLLDWHNTDTADRSLISEIGGTLVRILEDSDHKNSASWDLEAPSHIAAATAIAYSLWWAGQPWQFSGETGAAVVFRCINFTEGTTLGNLFCGHVVGYMLAATSEGR